MTRLCHGVAQATPARPPFVGRSRELTQLTRMFEAAERGQAQLAIIRGPAGIGKTRLAEELLALAAPRGALSALGGCWQDGEAPPLWPWRTILRELGAPATLVTDGTGAGTGRFARFVAVLERLRAATRRRPAVIVIDDAHLADPASLLLGRFVSRARELALLLVLTCRDARDEGETATLLGELSGQGVSVALDGLPEDAVRAFLTGAGGLDAVDVQLLEAVTSVTRGNPLHLRSVALRSALQADGLRGGLERAIAELLPRVSRPDRRLLALAALIGPEVSSHELGRVADVTPAEAGEALERATATGLMRAVADERFGFVHDVVRQVAAGSLPLAERLDAHARAASALAGDEPRHWSQRAHHALAAAGRSPEDARRAVHLAREAARALQAVDGFEAGAGLLARAAAIQAAAALTHGQAGLAIERAEAVLACGRLAQARDLFQAAARAADAEGDLPALARAALGLGGVWISEHRHADEAERVRALQRRALDSLPPDAHVLRARLRMRLAAEAAYRGGTLAAVLDELARVRALHEARALAEALSLAHHALLVPEHTWRRLPLAQELSAAAAAAGDSLLSLTGSCWQTVDLFLLGDPAAPAALQELRERADALRCQSVLFIARCMEVMLAIRAGELEAAERAAGEAVALGREVGDADALPYHGAHLSAIRYFQGREAELCDVAASLATSPMLLQERERAFACSAALFALRAGHAQPAQALLQRLRRDGLGSLPAASSWLTTLLAVIELTSELDDAELAQAAYDALLPYADLPLMASLAVVCFGSTHRALGVAARTCGKLELAVEHFAAALAANEQLGHRPAAAQARAELALARLRRAAPAPDARGQALLRHAVDEGEALGLRGLVARWRAAAAALPQSADASDEPAAALMTLVQGGKWRVVHGRYVATVRDRVGMRYLAQLLAAPERDVPALALVLNGAHDPQQVGTQPLLDRRALTALRERVRELQAEAEASLGARDELRTLTEELARVSGLGGRVRSFADAPERARTAVRKALKRAIDEIATANPSVGRHLAERVVTGAVCRYSLARPVTAAPQSRA